MKTRIKELRLQNKLTLKEVGEAVNLGESTISQYESEKREPSLETLIGLADLFGVSVDYLLCKDNVSNVFATIIPRKGVERTLVNYSNQRQEYVRIPVLGSIKAGIPQEAIEEIIDFEDIPESYTTGGREYFALKINGDSMAPRYQHGDIIIVRKQETCDSGKDCVVLVNGDEATFKRVIRHRGGITLQPLNPTYPPMYYNNEEIETKPVKILGVAVELRTQIV